MEGGRTPFGTHVTPLESRPLCSVPGRPVHRDKPRAAVQFSTPGLKRACEKYYNLAEHSNPVLYYTLALAKPVPALGGYLVSNSSSTAVQVHQCALSVLSITLGMCFPQPVQDLFLQIEQMAVIHILSQVAKWRFISCAHTLTNRASEEILYLAWRRSSLSTRTFLYSGATNLLAVGLNDVAVLQVEVDGRVVRRHSGAVNKKPQ